MAGIAAVEGDHQHHAVGIIILQGLQGVALYQCHFMDQHAFCI